MVNNFDKATVEGFGDEWQQFDQSKLEEHEARSIFDGYFSQFPWENLIADAEGFDLGCGSGRWARFVAPRVGRLHCIDASSKALAVAKTNLALFEGCVFHLADVGNLPLEPESMDFGYSLGVLHHVPDTQGGIDAAAALLKPGAPFLIYLYYAFDDRPAWFKWLWRASDLVRRAIARLPFKMKVILTTMIAALLYLPLARVSLLMEKLRVSVDSFPLSFYRRRSFYVMRTDALDRFGTRVERRFTRDEIEAMMSKAGFADIRFSDREPYWCAVGVKA